MTYSDLVILATDGNELDEAHSEQKIDDVDNDSKVGNASLPRYASVSQLFSPPSEVWPTLKTSKWLHDRTVQMEQKLKLIWSRSWSLPANRSLPQCF